MTPETQDQELHPHVEQFTLESLSKRVAAIEAVLNAVPESEPEPENVEEGEAVQEQPDGE